MHLKEISRLADHKCVYFFLAIRHSRGVLRTMQLPTRKLVQCPLTRQAQAHDFPPIHVLHETAITSRRLPSGAGKHQPRKTVLPPADPPMGALFMKNTLRVFTMLVVFAGLALASVNNAKVANLPTAASVDPGPMGLPVPECGPGIPTCPQDPPPPSLR